MEEESVLRNYAHVSRYCEKCETTHKIINTETRWNGSILSISVVGDEYCPECDPKKNGEHIATEEEIVDFFLDENDSPFFDYLKIVLKERLQKVINMFSEDLEEFTSNTIEKRVKKLNSNSVIKDTIKMLKDRK